MSVRVATPTEEIEPLAEVALWASRVPHTDAFLQACRAAGYKYIVVKLLGTGAITYGFYDPRRPPEIPFGCAHNIGPRAEGGRPAIWALAEKFVGTGQITGSDHNAQTHGPCRVNPGDYDLAAYDFTITGRTSSSKPNMQNVPRSPREIPEEALIEEAKLAVKEGQ